MQTTRKKHVVYIHPHVSCIN